MTKRRLRPWQKLVLGLLVILGGYFGYTYARQLYWERELANYLADLGTREPGWEWETRFGKLPELKPEENAAAEVKAILRLLTVDVNRNTLGKNEWSDTYYAYEGASKENEVHNYLKDHPQARLPEANLEKLAKLLSSPPCPEAMRRARLLHQFLASRLAHKYRPILVTTLLPDVQAIRDLARIFAYSAQVNLEKGNTSQAADDIHAMLGLLRLFDNDPFMISQIVRIAILQYSTQALHRWLAQTEAPTPAQLLQFQERILAEETRISPMTELLRWDRAIVDHDLKILHSGEMSLRQFLEERDRNFYSTFVITGWSWLDHALAKIHPTLVLSWWAQPRDYARERLDHLRLYDHLLGIMALPEEQWLAALQKSSDDGYGCSPFVHCLMLFGSSYTEYQKNRQRHLTQYVRALLSARAHCRTMATALAAERYRLVHQTWPTTWEQLTPKYLLQVLNDPFTGKPLTIKPMTDGLVMYSVGYNGVDDAGKIFPIDNQLKGDIGYQLWNVAERRKDMTKELEEHVKVQLGK